MALYEIRGKFLMGEKMHAFVKECNAEKESHAIEHVYSEFGSKHKTPRNKIKIEGIKKKE
jgi:large subunit ribosomal protein LX